MASIKTTLHAGTHADAPLHFINDGIPINKVSLSRFIGECIVLEVDTEVITGEYVDNHFPKSTKRLLLKSSGKAYFEKTGAEEAAYFGYDLIGTDAMSIGSPSDQVNPHRAILGEEIAVLENLDLSRVKPGRYFLVALPLKLQGMDASPVRAVLLDGHVFWSN